MKHRSREDRSTRLVSWLVLFLLATILLDGWDEYRDEIENNKRDDAREEVSRVLDVIEAQTSPEAQRRQEDRVQGLVLLIDCNTRQAFQEALDALDDDVLEPGAVVVTENCPQEDP